MREVGVIAFNVLVVHSGTMIDLGEIGRRWKTALLCLALALATLINPALAPGVSQAASQRTLSWSVVDTPADGSNGMVIRTCGINDLALGPDGKTFYAADIANNGFYKSTNAGYTWPVNLAANLTSPSTNPGGAFLPVWNVVVAPDDVNFVIAITDGTGAPITGGPRVACFSIDGGSNWSRMLDPVATLNPSEYISCLDISGDRKSDV
jgi:hypothetical protein